jgi:Ser/Thr protein kinase RdoA (MazF antagonist)
MLEFLNAFGFNSNETQIEIYGSGLINSTWLLTHKKEQYILQKINQSVFKQPELIAENIKNLSEYIKQTQPHYLFVNTLPTSDGEHLLKLNNTDYYRLFSFIQNSITHQNVNTPEIAYQAAKTFGNFTKMFLDFNSHKLNITIPNFHNILLRYEQFNNAISNASIERKIKSTYEINFLKSQERIVHEFEGIINNSNFKLRVTHHDTKISNVLFNETDKGLCVIDLDTVMPGYFISDVGDMMRTYLSAANEEEKDFDKIIVRDEYFKAIADGYLSEMKNEFTTDELNHFFYAGEFLIYMQALRFLTDYLNNDVYYGAKYAEHNFIRACNQINLLQKYQSKKEIFIEYINSKIDHS